VQFALEAHPEMARTGLSGAALRARLRDAYGRRGEELKDLVELLRQVPRPSAA
jgi:hypothetical protein